MSTHNTVPCLSKGKCDKTKLNISKHAVYFSRRHMILTSTRFPPPHIGYGYSLRVTVQNKFH